MLYFDFKKAIIFHEEEVLEVERMSEFSEIQEINSLKEPYEKLWKIVFKFNNEYEKWMNGPLNHVDAQQVEQEVIINIV